MGHPDADLRIQAALALGTQRRPEAIEALHRRARRSGRQRPVSRDRSARQACASRRRSIAWPAIAASGDFFLAFPAIEALVRIGDPLVAPRLAALLDDDAARAASRPKRSAASAMRTPSRRSSTRSTHRRPRSNRSSMRWRAFISAIRRSFPAAPKSKTRSAARCLPRRPLGSSRRCRARPARRCGIWSIVLGWMRDPVDSGGAGTTARQQRCAPRGHRGTRAIRRVGGHRC